ncbi:uncharacterized protein LOC127544126 [Antechinus flavipes]|uniref:uncharacterized protein LOC127544126 n=1 Tax=Antechinus flavipes TaxID=38775 RepID=UPI0022359AA3|nr:uncharacterized protein LOC127544126 [Antechinus flavipes]
MQPHKPQYFRESGEQRCPCTPPQVLDMPIYLCHLGLGSPSFPVSPPPSPPRRGASKPPFSLFFLFLRNAQAPGAKNNQGSGERRVPTAQISDREGGWRRRGRPMQRIARRRRQPRCCGRQLKNGSRKLLLTMNEGIRFTRQGPPAKLGFPAGFSNHICIPPPSSQPLAASTAHWLPHTPPHPQSRSPARAFQSLIGRGASRLPRRQGFYLHT